jgi:phosphopantothenoylcysteine decarboxylase
LSDDALMVQFNDRSPTLRIVGPITKALACGDTGVGAMAEVADVVVAVQTMLARAQAA